MALGKRLAVIGIETPLTACRFALLIDKYPESAALLNVELGHERLFGRKEFVVALRAVDEERGGEYFLGELMFIGGLADSFTEDEIHRITEVKVADSLFSQCLDDIPYRCSGLIVEVAGPVTLFLQACFKKLQRTAVKNQPLLMEEGRILGVAKKEGVLNQGHQTPFLQGGVIRKDVMRKNENTGIHRRS